MRTFLIHKQKPFQTMKKYTYSQKIVFLIKSESLLHHARSLSTATSTIRKCFADQFGDAGGLNRFPISGGICEHWPEWAKNEVVQSVHEFQDALDESLKLWLACGRRAYTWRKLKDSNE
jgi:hypothetical protein